MVEKQQRSLEERRATFYLLTFEDPRLKIQCSRFGTSNLNPQPEDLGPWTFDSGYWTLKLGTTKLETRDLRPKTLGVEICDPEGFK